jgi:hypothetical protein
MRHVVKVIVNVPPTMDVSLTEFMTYVDEAVKSWRNAWGVENKFSQIETRAFKVHKMHRAAANLNSKQKAKAK